MTPIPTDVLRDYWLDIRAALQWQWMAMPWDLEAGPARSLDGARTDDAVDPHVADPEKRTTREKES